MKNVSISLEEDVALWVRVLAARRNTSVSRLVGQLLKEKMIADDSYQQAMEDYLAQKPYVTGGKGSYPRREAARFFVDRNLLVYARDSSDSLKQERAESWMRRLWLELSGALGVLRYPHPRAPGPARACSR